MLVHQLETAIAEAPVSALDQFARAVWAGLAADQLSETEAGRLCEAVEARRRALRRPPPGLTMPRVVVVREETQTAAGGTSSPVPKLSYRGPRQLVLRIPRPTTYDRSRSLERRRRLAASGPMPPAMAAAFTCGEQAVLRVIADEVREHGRCDRTLGEIAARAGVCRATAQNALRHAARLGLLTIEERRRPGCRNLANLVRITSREWLAWLTRGPRRGGSKISSPTDRFDFSKRGRDGMNALTRSTLTGNVASGMDRLKHARR